MTAPVAKKATAAELCAKFVDEWNTREHWDSGGVRMGADLDDLLAAARAEAVAEERARVGTMDADDSRTVAALMANPPAPSESLRRVLLGLGGEAVAPLEARVRELERDLALMTHSRDGFREAVIAEHNRVEGLEAELKLSRLRDESDQLEAEESSRIMAEIQVMPIEKVEDELRKAGCDTDNLTKQTVTVVRLAMEKNKLLEALQQLMGVLPRCHVNECLRAATKYQPYEHGCDEHSHGDDTDAATPIRNAQALLNKAREAKK